MLKFPRHKVQSAHGEVYYALGGFGIDGKVLGYDSRSMSPMPPQIFVLPHLTLTVLKMVYARNLRKVVPMRREKIGREKIAGGEVCSREVTVADLEYYLIGETDFGPKALQLQGPVCFSDSLVYDLAMLLRNDEVHEGIDDATQAHGIVGRDHLFRAGLELIEEDPSGWFVMIRERYP